MFHFNALDAKSVVNIREVVKELQAEGKTILLTSHNHEHIEMLCDEVYIILDQEVIELDESIKEKYFTLS